MKFKLLHIVFVLFAISIAAESYAQNPWKEPRVKKNSGKKIKSYDSSPKVQKNNGKKIKTYDADPKVKNDNGKKLKTYSSKPDLTRSAVDWQANRFEVTGGLGATAFLGDLGGQNGVGQPFIFDFEPKATRQSFGVGARYYVREYHAFRGMFSYGLATGSDSLTKYPNRRFRNITVKSPIYELSGVYEFHILKPDYVHMMGARTTRVFTGNRFGAYGYAGLGAFYYNPKGLLNGNWYKLAPLNTEGQGLDGGPRDYKRLGFSVPMGGGIYYLMNRNFKLGLDLGYRWTFTDYIDDVGGYYFDNDAIRAENGKLAAYFANPSVDYGNQVPNADWYTQNQPRGGFNSNDTYLFVQVTLSKNIGPAISNKDFKSGKGKKPKFEKKKFTPFKWLRERERKNKSYKNKKIKNGKRKFKQPGMKIREKKKKKKGSVSF